MDMQLIAGMDEAGRGSWAGPVVAAAVILPRGLRLPGLYDSKLVSAEQREILFKKIIEGADYGFGIATEGEIDQFGLLQATYSAFQRALKNLKVTPEQLLIDGRDNFHFEIPYTRVIRGDQIHRPIMAASIVAKVVRDRLMRNYAKLYPDYGFELHKGYGTAVHQLALEKHGPTRLHRALFKPINALKCSQSTFL